MRGSASSGFLSGVFAMPQPTFKVTKLQAAQRQLNTAIELWFAEGDPVSVHSLAYAAYEITHRLYRNAGHSNLLYDSKAIEDSERAEVVTALKRSANFFKHAEQEGTPDAICELRPADTILFLYMAAIGLRAISSPSEQSEALMLWHIVHTPGHIRDNAFKDPVTVSYLEYFAGVSRNRFLAEFRLSKQASRQR